MMQKSHDRTLVFDELEWQCSALRQHYDHCSVDDGKSKLSSKQIIVFGLDGLWFFCTSSSPFTVQMLVHGLKWSCHLALVNSFVERYHLFESLVCPNRECTGGGFMTHTAAVNQWIIKMFWLHFSRTLHPYIQQMNQMCLCAAVLVFGYPALPKPLISSKGYWWHAALICSWLTTPNP